VLHCIRYNRQPPFHLAGVNGALVAALHPLQSPAFSKHWQESVAHRKVVATAEGAIPPGNAQAKGLAVLDLTLESSADALTEG